MGEQKQDEFSEDDSEVLVRIVKAAQGRNARGRKGEWKEFLRKNKRLRAGPSDPAKHHWTTLAEFVKTFTDNADIQLANQIRDAELRSKRLLELAGTWRRSAVQDLVCQTYQHRKYKEYYTFPTSEEGWQQTDSMQTDDGSLPERLISLDCEMVDCDDKTKALARVCATDSDYEVLLDMLVKPNRPVVNYLTSITGISEADLADVTCGIQDAQAAVLRLITVETILVGHSLHNDLKALKIDHLRVIDTSFLFQYHNKPERYNVGLNSLCKAVLGYEFREKGRPHDCIEDARIPMRIVNHVLQHGIPGPIDVQLNELDEGQLSKLYIHSIPSMVSVDDIWKLIPRKYSCDLEAISWSNSKYGTTYAIFKSIEDANDAFEGFEGPMGQDSYGRPQKTALVTLRSKTAKRKEAPVKVRKMSANDGLDMKPGAVITPISESNSFDSYLEEKCVPTYISSDSNGSNCS